MTDRDENIICGVLGGSLLPFKEQERLCALARTPESQLSPTTQCPDGELHVLRCIRCELPATGVSTSSTSAIRHGINCSKVPHESEGYLHAERDDAPYDVDGMMYCGRCHEAIF